MHTPRQTHTSRSTELTEQVCAPKKKRKKEKVKVSTGRHLLCRVPSSRTKAHVSLLLRLRLGRLLGRRRRSATLATSSGRLWEKKGKRRLERVEDSGYFFLFIFLCIARTAAAGAAAAAAAGAAPPPPAPMLAMRDEMFCPATALAKSAGQKPSNSVVTQGEGKGNARLQVTKGGHRCMPSTGGTYGRQPPSAARRSCPPGWIERTRMSKKKREKRDPFIWLAPALSKHIQ